MSELIPIESSVLAVVDAREPGEAVQERRMPVGAEARPEGVHFRVWAPRRRRVAVVFDEPRGAPDLELHEEAGGYFSGFASGLGAGALYRFRLDDVDYLYPDPASRFQPEGPHGPSMVVDPSNHHWGDAEWTGIAREGQVLYELHVGTFTREGTFAAAMRELPWLRDLGVTAIELMPVAEFAGRFGWGYDGVDLFAPSHLYGTPDDLRRFVDRAHALSLGVILDVVYNHLGPSGNYLAQFSPDYFTDRYPNDWGQSINFDGKAAAPVRELFRANATYWIDEFHFDGLRLDAVQAIHDASPVHILDELARAVREAAGRRSTLLIAECESQIAALASEQRLDALWNDDFHHAARVALTGRREAYYTDYRGSPQELISAVRWGFLYQGQRYRWQRQRRGTPALDLPAPAFVNYVQNHDQVANSAAGHRLHALTTPGRWRAMTALLLLAPGTPMLFQGQEFASSAPFLYFADHEPELARLVAEGRREFLRQFPSLRGEDVQSRLAPPHDPATFERCKLDPEERERHREAVALHHDLLKLRREDPTFRAQDAGRLHGAVIGPEAFVLRWFGEAGEDRLLVVNLGADLEAGIAPEPLLAPPAGHRWRTCWSSESAGYGGSGAGELDGADGWSFPGHAAFVLAPGPIPEWDRRKSPPGFEIA
jgi:maltooligosyltrehalose trehalohydrolase